MKTVKSFLSLLCIIVVLQFSSCGWFGPQEYICIAEDVQNIQIVRIENIEDDEYKILFETSMVDTFINQLNNLEHSVNWGDPGVMENGYTVIKINYKNGDFDLIYHNAQIFYRSGKYQDGYFFFDEKQLNQLIYSTILPKPKSATSTIDFDASTITE